MPFDAVQIARFFLWVEEVPRGSNHGRWVEAIQRLGNSFVGAPWCACFLTMVLDLACAGKNPLPVTASCRDMLAFARAQGWVSTQPWYGHPFFQLDAQGNAHHCGIVSSDHTTPAGVVKEISGNTNNDGSREGYGVLELSRPLTDRFVFLKLPEPLA